MNNKGLENVLKVITAMVMVSAMTGCGTMFVKTQPGNHGMGDARKVLSHTEFEAKHPDFEHDFKMAAIRGGSYDEFKDSTFVLLGKGNGIFGGEIKKLWYWAPKELNVEQGDIVEIKFDVPFKVVRVVRKHNDNSPGGCNWGGGVPGVTTRTIYCGDTEMMDVTPEVAKEIAKKYPGPR